MGRDIYGGPEGYMDLGELKVSKEVPTRVEAGAMKNDLADMKPAIEYIHPKVIEGLGYALRAGAIKYASWDFTKGHGRLQLCAAMMRHLLKIMAGEDVDADTTARLGGKATVYHWDCVVACINMLVYQRELGTLKDDTPMEGVHYTKENKGA